MGSIIDGILITDLDVVPNMKGDIFHVLKVSSPGYQGFGEAYFSKVDKGKTKGWKRHNRVALNIVVPVGEILFKLYDSRSGSDSMGVYFECTLGIQNYKRLTIPPGLWVAFEGIAENNLLLNIIAEEHDPTESDNLSFEDFQQINIKAN